MTTPRVYVIHENPEWFPPFAAAFAAEGVPVEELLLTDGGALGSIDLTAEPAPGVYWSRMSASSHTRGNEHSKEYARALLGWLERSGATVVNGSHVLELEVSKVAQHGLLRDAGFDVPRTTAVFGSAALKDAARTFTEGRTSRSSRSTTRAARASASAVSTPSPSSTRTSTAPSSRPPSTASRCSRSS